MEQISLEICVSQTGEHISLEIFVPQVGEDFTKKNMHINVKTISFFFLFYNFFYRPFFSLLFYNLQTVKTLKQPVIAPVVGARILRTLLSHALLPFDVLVLLMHAFSVLLKYACHGHVFLHVNMTFLV